MGRNAKKSSGNKTVRYIVIALVLLTLITVAGIIAYSEFTKSSRTKRVIASYGGSGELFSSNYLEKHMSSDLTKRYVYTMTESSPAVTVVTVCNFAQGNQTVIYERDIPYTLTARFVTVSGNTATPASAGEVDSNTVALSFFDGTATSEKTLNSSTLSWQFSSTLSHLAATTHELVVTFNAGFPLTTGNLELEIVAEPAHELPAVSTIDAVFTTQLSTSAAVQAWEGYVDENMAVPKVPADFDGFNYVISGNGSGTCKLSWDSAKVTPSALFLADMGLTPADDTAANWKYVEFSVDSDTKDRYDLQFYRATGAVNSSGLIESAETVTFSSWDELTDSIELTYTQS